MDNNVFVYLDESGDLGWKFDKPYRNGGSSRYLTISSIIVPANKVHLPGRVIKDLYKKFNWRTDEERKWVLIKNHEKDFFAEKCVALANKHNDIIYSSITVYKPNVSHHIRNDSNQLYNYMIGLMLIDELTKYDHVCFIPDPRSIKVKSGNSLSDYIQIKLWFEKEVKTNLQNQPMNSSVCKGIQFVDMLSGIIQQHFEDGHSKRFDAINNVIKLKKLYFQTQSPLGSIFETQVNL